MKKKTSGYPAFQVSNTGTTVKQRLCLHTTFESMLDEPFYQSEDGFIFAIGSLSAQISKWREDEPEHPMHDYIPYDYGEPILKQLELLLENARHHLAKKNYFLLAQLMYEIGETVGLVNHIEGWSLGLSTANTKYLAGSSRKMKMKGEAIRIFKTGSFPSIAEAGRKIAPELEKFCIANKISPGKPDNRKRQIEKYLSEAKKEGLI